MKGEPLEKPPPLLLPPARLQPNLYSKSSSLKSKDKSLDQSAVHKFTTKYDMLHGILKRVSDMKLNGSLDSEEPSTTESEKSGSSASKSSKRDFRAGGSWSVDERSNASGFEDESSASSVTGSDHCTPYEDFRAINRYSCVSLPPYSDGSLVSFRNSFPPPPPSSPSPTDSFDSERRLVSRRKNSSECKAEVRRQCSCSNLNDDRSWQKRLSLEDVEGIVESEKHQLDVFFRSLKTDVYICGSLANLYFGWKGSEGSWTYRHTGVVVVIMDYGDTRSRRKRKIQIVLAERGTCFPLWKDTIDNLSDYNMSGSAFHTMHLSSDHRQLIGFSFDSPSEAEKLLKHIEGLTSNPENINISVPGSRKKSKSSPKKKAPPLPHKKQISNPCLFQHVTSVAARDKPIYMSLQTLIDDDIIKKKENIS